MKLKEMIPEVYYKQSIDFSYIANILEVALNYMKTNADLVNSNLNTIDSDDLLNSLAYTLGFQPRHKYINKDLINVCSNFNHILKNKGTIYAIDECIRVLLNSQYIKGDYVILADYDKLILEIGLPSETKDIVLLEDLFEYILPTGWIYSIVNISNVKEFVDIYYFNENNESTVKATYGNIAQVSRPLSISGLENNIEDVDDSEEMKNHPETQGYTPKSHSRLWSNIIYGKKIDNGGE